jgi:hypothetical protein
MRLLNLLWCHAENMERNCVPLGEGEGDRPKSLLWTKEPDPPWRGSVPGRIPWGPTIGQGSGWAICAGFFLMERVSGSTPTDYSSCTPQVHSEPCTNWRFAGNLWLVASSVEMSNHRHVKSGHKVCLLLIWHRFMKHKKELLKISEKDRHKNKMKRLE